MNGAPNPGPFRAFCALVRLRRNGAEEAAAPSFRRLATPCALR
jgi:hypothetical protein